MRNYMMTTCRRSQRSEWRKPAMAYDTGGLLSMQDALGVATDLGLATVSHTQFAGDEWQIEGRDRSGRWMEVDVNATTGEVRKRRPGLVRPPRHP